MNREINNIQPRLTSNESGSALTTALIGLACGAVFFVIGYVGTQTWLFDNDNQRHAARWVGSAHEALCKNGIRLPDTECRQPTLVVDDLVVERPGEPLAKAFARMPDMSAVVRKLRWNDGSEADAARFMAVVRNVGLARTNQARGNSEAMKVLAPKIASLWEQYPEMVVASACVYCGSQTRLLKYLIDGAPEGEGPGIGRLEKLFSSHPRLFRIIHERQPFDPAFQYRVARVYAELSGAGDSGTAQLIADILARNGDHDRLRQWANSGLNGGRALSDLDLDALPRDLVEIAWRQGVGMAYDDFTLTEYLFKRGYRPALRWVVWLQSSELPYIQDYMYERFARKYQGLIDQNTEFPVDGGVSLARFYNDHWNRIVWDSSQKVWRLE